MTIRRQREIHYWVIGDDENFIVFFVHSQLRLTCSFPELRRDGRTAPSKGDCHPLLYTYYHLFALRQLINND